MTPREVIRLRVLAALLAAAALAATASGADGD
jgi:hypothetical protein